MSAIDIEGFFLVFGIFIHLIIHEFEITHDRFFPYQLCLCIAHFLLSMVQFVTVGLMGNMYCKIKAITSTIAIALLGIKNRILNVFQIDFMAVSMALEIGFISNL